MIAARRIAGSLTLLSVAGNLGGAAAGGEAGSAPRARFTDVAAEVGLVFVHEAAVEGQYWMPESIGAGGALLDYDGDGDLDVYLVNGAWRGGRSTVAAPPVNRLFRQEISGRFLDVTARSGLGDPGYGMGVAAGDIDGDGDLDVYLTNVGPDRLYRNRGDGSFEEVTAAAGIDAPGWSTSAAFVDYDLDGDLDLYAAYYVDFDPAVVCADAAGRRDYCGPAGFAGVADRLWRNDGDGRFTDVSEAAGIAAVAGKGLAEKVLADKGLGVVAADLDGDARPDIYVANDGEPNRLWIDRGDGTFEDRAVELGAAVDLLGRPQAGMGVALGDADGDARPDLFVTHLRGESNTLYRRLGPELGSTAATAETGGAGAALGSTRDAVPGRPGLGFADATLEAGLAGASLPWTGFGTAFLDVDHDGDLDLAVVNGRVTRGPPVVTPEEAPAAGLSEHWAPYAEPAQLYVNDGAGRFALTGDGPRGGAGFASLPPGNGRGLAAGDVDGDGDLDLLVTNGGGPARLLRNELIEGVTVAGAGVAGSHPGRASPAATAGLVAGVSRAAVQRDDEPRHWLRVRLEEPGRGRDGAGAAVTVRAGGRLQVRPAATGGSFLSASEPTLHFGLGTTATVDELTVQWPGGDRLRLLGLPADRTLVVRRPAGEGAP